MDELSTFLKRIVNFYSAKNFNIHVLHRHIKVIFILGIFEAIHRNQIANDLQCV